MSDLIALSFDLMTSHDEVQLVLVEESFRHIWPKLTAHSPLTDGTAVLHEREKEISNCYSSQNIHIVGCSWQMNLKSIFGWWESTWGCGSDQSRSHMGPGGKKRKVFKHAYFLLWMAHFKMSFQPLLALEVSSTWVRRLSVPVNLSKIF